MCHAVLFDFSVRVAAACLFCSLGWSCGFVSVLTSFGTSFGPRS